MEGNIRIYRLPKGRGTEQWKLYCPSRRRVQYQNFNCNNEFKTNILIKETSHLPVHVFCEILRCNLCNINGLENKVIIIKLRKLFRNR
jgi:hypothetical protein